MLMITTEPKLDCDVDTAVELEAVDEPRSELGTSVGKAMALLTAFDRSTPIGVSELARKADLPKSTAFRLLAILEQFHLVERVESRYRLGTKLFELGNQVAYCCPRSLREIAHPYLEELHKLSHETAQLAILDGCDVLYLDKVFGHDHVRTPSHVGRRVPAHAAALGKVLLADSSEAIVDEVLSRPIQPLTRYTIFQPHLFRDELASIRRNGVAFDREEVSLGLVCVAAPVRNVRGETVAAISVSGKVGRFDPDRFVGHVRRVAAAVGDQLYS
jgi:IclR family transcriptional regulator, KDG regulon repressor